MDRFLVSWLPAYSRILVRFVPRGALIRVMIEDTALLRRYVDDASEAAFAELVGRHIDLVYATALRRTDGQRELAEEATQQAFVLLAREARTLTQHPTLAGWLYVAARHAAANLRRGEQARRVREQEAFVMNQSAATEQAVDWNEVRPELEQLIERLEPRERDAIVLRFFQARSYADIGATLNCSDDATRMRIDRALEKLRRLLATRGVASTASALAVALTSQSVVAAPQGLVASVTLAALASGGAAAVTAAGFFSFMNMA